MLTERKCTCNKLFPIKVRGPQHREIGFPISTGNASWGGAPTTEAGGKSAYNNVQVGGAPTQKLTESQLTIMWKLGSDDEINFMKIISVPPHSKINFTHP